MAGYSDTATQIEALSTTCLCFKDAQNKALHERQNETALQMERARMTVEDAASVGADFAVASLAAAVAAEEAAVATGRWPQMMTTPWIQTPPVEEAARDAAKATAEAAAAARERRLQRMIAPWIPPSN